MSVRFFTGPCLLRGAGALLLLLLFHACGHKGTVATPDEQIREAWKQFRLSEFNDALRIFQSVENSQQPGSEAHLQSLYGEASCWNHRRDGRDIAKAVAAYRAVVEEAPQNPLAAWSVLDIVRTRHLAPADQPIDYGKTRSRLRGCLSELSGDARGRRGLSCTRAVFHSPRLMRSGPARYWTRSRRFFPLIPRRHSYRNSTASSPNAIGRRTSRISASNTMIKALEAQGSRSCQSDR